MIDIKEGMNKLLKIARKREAHFKQDAGSKY